MLYRLLNKQKKGCEVRARFFFSILKGFQNKQKKGCEVRARFFFSILKGFQNKQKKGCEVRARFFFSIFTGFLNKQKKGCEGRAKIKMSPDKWESPSFTLFFFSISFWSNIDRCLPWSEAKLMSKCPNLIQSRVVFV